MRLPSIAVVTPFCRESEAHLRACVDSVARQSVACHHVLVSDGAPEPIDALARAWVREGGDRRSYVRLPVPHADYGDTPRLLGTLSAFRRGFGAVLWLDGDNFYREDHVASLAGLQAATGAEVCTSTRMLCDAAGAPLGPCPETSPAAFIDTSAYLVTPSPGVVAALSVFTTMPASSHAFGDRVFFAELERLGVTRRHSYLPTLFYRTTYAAHYAYFGLEPPPGAKPNVR